MKKYKNYVKKYWYCFLLGPLFMIIEACGEFILPFLNANIINTGASSENIPYIVKNGIYMLIIAIIMLITGLLGANFAIRGSARLGSELRKDTFKKIQKFSYADIDKFTTGSLITRITNDVNQIQNFAENLLRGFFRSPVMLIGAIVMSFSLSISISWVILAVVPILATIIIWLIIVSSPRYTKMQKSIDTMNTNISENVTNIRLIKSFVREDYEQNKFDKINNNLYEKSTSALKMMLLLQPLLAFIVNFATLFVILLSGKKIMIGAMELGTLTAFITYLTQIMHSLNMLANIILNGTRARASDKRISEILNAEILLNDDNVTDKNLIVKNGNIEFKNVSFKYNKNDKIDTLTNINLKINAGELIGIIGSTGSGKTTLVSLIPRLYDSSSGEIFIDDINIKKYPLYNLRESIAMVLQKNTLFAGTIAENLRWGNKDATIEELINATKIAEAHGFIESFPLGYETELGQGGVNLSGGQKQRLCIARALLKNPKILILDDSTSAVDTATDASIRKAFREKLPKITKIIIAQRINSVIDADKIIVIDDGKIVGIGSHEELMNKCAAYTEIYLSQKDACQGGDNNESN